MGLSPKQIKYLYAVGAFKTGLGASSKRTVPKTSTPKVTKKTLPEQQLTFDQSKSEFESAFPKGVKLDIPPDKYPQILTALKQRSALSLMRTLIPEHPALSGYQGASLRVRSSDLTGGGMSVRIIARLQVDGDRQTGPVEVVRTYDLPTNNAGKAADHEYFVISPDLQGKGVGKALYDKHVEYAKSLGCKRITTWANCDVGGYMWAKQGFDFTEPNKILPVVREKAIAGQANPPQGTTSEQWAQVSTFLKKKRRAEEIANLTIDGVKFGPHLLLGQSWNGSKQVK